MVILEEQAWQAHPILAKNCHPILLKKVMASVFDAVWSSAHLQSQHLTRHAFCSLPVFAFMRIPYHIRWMMSNLFYFFGKKSCRTLDPPMVVTLFQTLMTCPTGNLFPMLGFARHGRSNLEIAGTGIEIVIIVVVVHFIFPT